MILCQKCYRAHWKNVTCEEFAKCMEKPIVIDCKKLSEEAYRKRKSK